MKTFITGLCALLFGLSLVFSSSVMASGQDDLKDKKVKKESIKKKAGPKNKSKQLNRMPIYKPPLRGAPAGRVAAGTRGIDQELPYLCLIVPDHIGLTMSTQPTLYYYQSKPTPFPVEFTLIQKQGITPIVETRITPSKPSGIQTIRLADYGVRLEQGIQYKWFVALVADPQRRSKDILAAGSIECVAAQDTVTKKLADSEASQAAFVYAEAGLWYDAFDSISLMIEKSPGNTSLEQQRDGMLEQIGLDQVTDQ